MIDRKKALELIEEHVDNGNLVKHMHAVEAVMRSLAERFGEDVELWSITGLLHDLDASKTADDPDKHSFITTEILQSELPDEALRAINVHPGHIEAETKLDIALLCADPVTGLITAATLTHPSRSLHELQVKSVKKRFKDKRFAAGASREQMRRCVEIGLELDEFLQISLESMRKISDTLEL